MGAGRLKGRNLFVFILNVAVSYDNKIYSNKQ